MKRSIRGGLAVAALVVSLTLTVCGLRWIHGELLAPAVEPCRLPEPVLAASAGDGEVTLSWKLGGGLRTAVKAWQYRQALQGESWSGTGSTGPAATVYVVSGLTNDVAYTFQVRARLGAADFGCWSAAVSVVPRRIDDVVERMERHQEAIVQRMSEVVENMAASQELQRELGEQGIATLGAVAASTSAIAKHSAGIRDGVVQVTTSVDAAGQHVAAATMSVAQQAAGIRNGMGELVGSVDVVRQKVADGLAEVADQLGKVCDGCGALPANCLPLGRVFFDHNSHHIWNENGNRETFNRIVAGLRGRKGGLFLTEGYATAVGYARHNLHLSDMRAACVSRCLRDRLAYFGPEDGKFEFREIARGEIFGVNNLVGANEENQRVDVTFCPGYSDPDPTSEKRSPVWPDDCECPDLPI